jgi:ABC-type lipoprotein release transport system permease subunit
MVINRETVENMSLITSLLIYVGIVTSLVYMASLRQSFQTYPSDNTTEHFPPIQGTTTAHRMAQLPAIAVPLLFIGTWVVLLIQQVALITR